MSARVERPRNLKEWRHPSQTDETWNPRALWHDLDLSPIFLAHGYHLWPPSKRFRSGWASEEPDKSWKPRVFDGFAHLAPYGTDHQGRFMMEKTIHCPARTSDGRDVLIRLVAIGSDREEAHQKALERLAIGHTAALGANHVLPVLDKIEHEDMLFYVFPLMAPGFSQPWYYSFNEIVDVCEQVLEGIDFCHERLVAHLDLDDDNILLNWAGGQSQPTFSVTQTWPFRSFFPARYYIIDFELCVVFEMDSDPADRMVRGLPTAQRGGKLSNYGRHAAPEMLSNEPYCPFRADIWQLGRLFDDSFGHLEHISPDMVQLFRRMRLNNPTERPSSSEALAQFRQIKRQISPGALWQEDLPRPPEQPMPPALAEFWRKEHEEMDARAQARKKQEAEAAVEAIDGMKNLNVEEPRDATN